MADFRQGYKKAKWPKMTDFGAEFQMTQNKAKHIKSWPCLSMSVMWF